MFDFKDLRPDWEREKPFKTREDLKQLGCSQALIDWLLPEGSYGGMMVPPEDWFWRDSDWYKRTSDTKRELIQELHFISGGTFDKLDLKTQCDMLNIECKILEGQKIKGARGKWEGRNGPTGVEQYALEQLQPERATGFSCEGLGYSAWSLVRDNLYKRRTGKIAGFEKVDGQHVSLTPSETHAREYLASLKEARKRIRQEYDRDPWFHDHLWGSLSLGDVLRFPKLIKWVAGPHNADW